jgi:hypothetical protein
MSDQALPSPDNEPQATTLTNDEAIEVNGGYDPANNQTDVLLCPP